jgi:high-affinity iron transporter
VLLVGAAFALKLIGQRLQPRPFMLASSGLLALLAVVLIGKGVRALQEAGVIGISTLGGFSVPTLGFHATTQGLLAQGSILALLIGSALWTWREDQRTIPPVPTAAE